VVVVVVVVAVAAAAAAVVVVWHNGLYVGEVDERVSRRSDWDVDDRRHSGAGRNEQISSSGRTAYSDRSVSVIWMMLLLVEM